MTDFAKQYCTDSVHHVQDLIGTGLIMHDCMQCNMTSSHLTLLRAWTTQKEGCHLKTLVEDIRRIAVISFDAHLLQFESPIMVTFASCSVQRSS